ncbi:MAG: phytanoyl-CoA dioxygenase family protein [Planctomycetaceae bacterium]|nr:phytanoyl-CoA dioxygenase family protein [Planctomycetaceae bacterium]
MSFTASEIEAYRRDGYVIARGVLAPDDVAALRGEAQALWQRADDGAAGQHTSHFGVKKMTTLRDPQLHSSVYSRYLTDPRLVQRMAQLVGPNVQLHHSKINVKTRDDRAVFPLHQDHPYFPHAQHSVCTVLVHLTSTTSARGCFRAIPGVTRPLEHIADDGHILDPRRYPLESAIELPAEAGDVVFMNYLTPHGSNLNASDEPRVLWILQVRAAEDRPLEQPPGTQQATPPGNRPGQGTMLAGVNPDFAWAASGASSRL